MTVTPIEVRVEHLTVVELPLPAVMQEGTGTATVEVIGRPAICCVEVITKIVEVVLRVVVVRMATFWQFVAIVVAN
jgi:hypothetical protein